MPPRRRASPVSKDERETNRELLAVEAAILLALLRAEKKRDPRAVERDLLEAERRVRLLARERVAAELRFPTHDKPVAPTTRVVRRIDMGDGTFREVILTNASALPPPKKGETSRFRKLARKVVVDANARDRAAAQSASPRAAQAAAKSVTESQVRMIATTETMTAFARERERAAREIARATGAPLFKEWRATLDKRACERCSALHGERLALAVRFENGDPPLHPRCRCWVLYSVEDVTRAELAAYWRTQSEG